ncbi:uncharacterized protein [Leptinotarsa decemlineata]|uniref:uncharacterized protein n=1 Tax=Leptinotarsa decemlineata TaxID=7539 RepID=UPI003D30CB4A
MTNKTTKKGKKPLQTTLGKASLGEKEVDLSLVGRPIDTSIFGLKQVLTLFQTATEEVKNYIIYECEIMYECRICKSIYRSLANFILHKRNYCRDKFIPTASNRMNCGIQDYAHSPRSPEATNVLKSGSLKTPKPPDTGEQVANKGLSPVIEKLKEKQEINQLTCEILNTDLSKEESKGPVSSLSVPNNDFLLEEIATNNAAVFQTMLKTMSSKDLRKPDFMKSEVMEIHGILDSDEAVLGADGKICNFQTNRINSSPIIPKTELSCTECNMKFSTKKTLVCHLRNKHNNSRLVYLCPDCKETYANAWGVFRHLFKFHRKTPAQVKRLRQQVHNSIIRKDEEPHKKGEKKEAVKFDKTDEENQWLNNIEGDNDFQMCGGCGKRFERKAALHSHAQMCTKRIAVCNTIKENNAKKKEGESKDTKMKQTKVDKPLLLEAPLKGASKRKPYLLRTYKTVGEADTQRLPQNNCDVNANTKNKEIVCDIMKSEKEEENSRIAPEMDKIDAQHVLDIIGIASKEQIIGATKESSPTPEGMKDGTIDFDSFCQRVGERIRQIHSTPERKDSATTRDENHSNSSPDVSMCSISIRSLEELKGFPKETESRDAEDASPKSRKSPRRPSKRKRTLSQDSAKTKPSKIDSLLEKADVGFMRKIQPYINPEQLTCKPCQQRFPAVLDLLRHMSAHFSWFRFQCSRCSFMAYDETDCADHAETAHSESDIGGVVLPIPNWKTVLMSNEFPANPPRNEEVAKEKDVTGAPDDNIIATLFVDSEEMEEIDAELDALPFLTHVSDHMSCIKHESIDIVEESKDSFKLDDPQEMFSTFEIVKVIDNDTDEYDFRSEFDVKEEIISADDEDFVIMKSLGSEPKGPPSPGAIKEEVVVCKDDEFEELTETTNQQTLNSRPTRNRVRSFKTLQEDFFYEQLGNRTSASQKQKKNGSGALAKKGIRGLRVYSNKQ